MVEECEIDGSVDRCGDFLALLIRRLWLWLTCVVKVHSERLSSLGTISVGFGAWIVVYF